jgi:hypothetical protein
MVPTILFDVTFSAGMSQSDLALLVRTLGLVESGPGSRSRPGTIAFTRLDDYSGLFLEHGASEERWSLNARTWGHPPSDTVHRWYVLTAAVAHQLDPSVVAPEREPVLEREIPSRPLGAAANRRFARVRRRLVGVEY